MKRKKEKSVKPGGQGDVIRYNPHSHVPVTVIPSIFNDVPMNELRRLSLLKKPIDLTKERLQLDKKTPALVAGGVVCPLVGREVALVEYMLARSVGERVEWSKVHDAIRSAGSKDSQDHLRSVRDACRFLSTKISETYGYKVEFLTVKNKRVTRNF